MAEATEVNHDSIIVDVPSQGVFKVFANIDEVRDWFAAESSWLNGIQTRLSGKINFVGDSCTIGTGLKLSDPADIALFEINKSNNKEADVQKYVEIYCAAAGNFETIVSESYFGRRLSELRRSDDDQALKLFAGIVLPEYTNFMSGQIADYFRIARTALLWHPGFRTQIDLISAEDAKKTAHDAQAKAETARRQLGNQIQEWEGRISELERRYREQIALKEPAIYWRRKAVGHWWAAVASLLLFIAILAGGLLLGWWFIDDVERFLTATATTEGTGSLVRGLAVVTVPTLAIAWLLRHVSRIFVQNFTQRHDALHREMLAYTYLALAENEDMELGEQERALILNALFRPGPPHTGDDGPPMGLIDFIKPK